MENIKQRKAKFVAPAVYVLCTIVAMILAYHYFEGVESAWLRFGAVILAGIFNIPFLVFYSVWHVALKNNAPQYSKEEFKRFRQTRFGRSSGYPTSQFRGQPQGPGTEVVGIQITPSNSETIQLS
jgi:hypothetical protein